MNDSSKQNNIDLHDGWRRERRKEGERGNGESTERDPTGIVRVGEM